MKRSEINAIMRDADTFIRSCGFRLPPFAAWTPEEFRRHRADAGGILDTAMGWDITDFGSGDFDHVGLFLFTVRNGKVENLKKGGGKLYAEKLMVIQKDQVCPCHTHAQKVEDIINRGGGILALKLDASGPDGRRDPSLAVEVLTDGVRRRLDGDHVLRLTPGESVTLEQGTWHAFWGEGDKVLVGEVSTVNDDDSDNLFFDPVSRFPSIEEDEPPLHLLVKDYGRLAAA